MKDLTPMKMGRIAPHIERGYRAGHAYQWVRETAKNAFEAGAKNVRYGVEWQGVEATGTYRLVIVDDGCGMLEDELRAYFQTFGGGGKTIGATEENYGIGSKTSLFPWNRAGLIVVSRRDGEEWMIRVEYDEATEEYGLVREVSESGKTLDVYPPYEDEDLGIDFAQLLPEKGAQGTAILLLGNGLHQDTILGDPDRDEQAALGAINIYMDGRFFAPPEGIRVIFEEWPEHKADWPATKPKSLNSKYSNVRTRVMKGLTHFITQPGAKGGHTLSGTVDLGTAQATWFLREGVKYTGGGYAQKPSIGVRLENEVFYLNRSYQRMRLFGITEKAVRERLWVIIDPPKFSEATYQKDHSHYGVYMKADRSTLNWGGAILKDEMPWADWGEAFARQMPAEIAAALAAAAPEPESGEAKERLYTRLKERIAARLNRTIRYLRDADGKAVATLDQPGRGRRRRVKDKEANEGAKEKATKTNTPAVKPVAPALNQGTQSGKEAASQNRPVRHGLPEFVWRAAEEFEGEWILARFDRNGGEHGLIVGNKNHAAVREAVDYWRDKMVLQDEKTMSDVRELVMEAFEELAIATVASTESLLSSEGLTRQDLDGEFRSDAALTTALMGIVGIDALVGPRLTHVGKTVKKAA